MPGGLRCCCLALRVAQQAHAAAVFCVRVAPIIGAKGKKGLMHGKGMQDREVALVCSYTDARASFPHKTNGRVPSPPTPAAFLFHRPTGKASEPSAVPTDPRAAYSALLDVLRGQAKPPGGSAAKQGKRKGAAAGAGGGAAALPPLHIVVLDEVDRLLRQREGTEELVRLFQLPTVPGECEPCGQAAARAARLQTG